MEAFNIQTYAATPYVVSFLTTSVKNANDWACSLPSCYNTLGKSVSFVITDRLPGGFTITTDQNATVEFIVNEVNTEAFNIELTGGVPYVVQFLNINTAGANDWAMSLPSCYNAVNESVGFTISARTGNGFTVTVDEDARFETIVSVIAGAYVIPEPLVSIPRTVTCNILIPFLNPIRFHSETAGDFFYNQLKDWEQQTGFNQKYQWGDIPGLQFIAPFQERSGGATIKLVDLNDNLIQSWGLYCNESAYDGYCYRWLSGFPLTGTDGIYFLRITLPGIGGQTLKFLSEPISLKVTHPNTAAIVYTNDQNDFDCMFVSNATYPPFMLRLEAGVKNDGWNPGGVYTMFQDLDLDPVILNATPNDVYRFTFGDSYGIPNYLASKLNRIFSLSTILIDGIGYAKSEGAKLEALQRDQFFPLSPWSMDLILSENLYSDVYGACHPLTHDLNWSISAITFDMNITFDQLTY